MEALDRKEQMMQSLTQLQEQIQFASIDARPLKALSNIVPPSVSLESLGISLADNARTLKFDISGDIYAKVTTTDVELIKFVQQLEGTGYFQNIQIEKTKKFTDVEQPGMFFNLTFQTR
ncbi:MAG: PilN domain-containing protein [Candidatus Marinimicrobia bacterium]|nr:PilN domain-containing protein [Candidatus Neomarinimicrobiota bacterium]MCF7830181.1 PilN domain-containing protein [Candidatus Neomarinimicrobiota bacterium]MCF7882085.1 PilN domain-containing protein [Candidatus Neomarinimicrobiota bacterium]